MFDIAAIEKYLNNLLILANNKEKDFDEARKANEEFLHACRFLKRFFPQYMTFPRFQEWIDKNHFATVVEPIIEKEEIQDS